MNWQNIKNIYMIGIKGVGMTMLAQYLAGQGIKISGSDTAEVFMTDEVLAKAKIKVNQGFSGCNLDIKADLIIYSTAYNEENNVELKIAKASGVKTITYAEALADVFNQSFGIAVAGSHGKTTTTAWLGFVLAQAGLDPNVMVGARVPQFDGSSLIGKSNLLVAEADEYQNKIGALNPKLALINNIDYDHPDFYPNESGYLKVFADFINKLSSKDVLVVNFDDKKIIDLTNKASAKILSYGIENNSAEFVAFDIKYQNGRQYFKVKMGEEDLGDFSIRLLGRHNISNALAVIAASLELGAELHLVRGAVADFSGTNRRLEKMGEYHGAQIFDDYAHHPTEIKATIEALRQLFPDKKLSVVFHPHTFSRTEALLADFAKSFANIDKLIVLEVYSSAREVRSDFSSQTLIEEIKKSYPDLEIVYQPDLEKAETYLKQTIKQDEVVVLMGAGDVFRIGKNLIKNS